MHQPTTKTVGSEKLCSPHAGQKSCALFSGKKEAASVLHLFIIKTLLRCGRKAEPSNFSKTVVVLMHLWPFYRNMKICFGFVFLLTYFSKDWAAILLKVILGESFMFGRLYWMSYFLNMHCLSGREKTDSFSYRYYLSWTLGPISEPFLLRATPKLSSLLGYCLRISIATMKDHDQKEVLEGRAYLTYTFILLFIIEGS